MMKKRQLLKIARHLIVPLLLILVSSSFVSAQTIIFNQTPDQSYASATDIDTPQSVADNFIVTSPVDVTQIRIWGIYYNSDSAPATDNFTVIFHNDAAGIPGTVISTQTNVPVSRQVTGNVVGGANSTEYIYTLTLATPVNLVPGTYWVEIYNDTTADTDDDFYWETGNVDSTNGILNAVLDGATPGVTWSSSTADRAIEITAVMLNPSNGHYYSLMCVENDSISWDEARTAAESQTFNGIQGHLATITSSSENDFIYNTFPLGESAWIGGYQLDSQSSPQVGWQWVTGEQFSFLNWEVNQPNDNDVFPGNENNEENCIEFDVTGFWLDTNCSNGLLCYIVEYDQSESVPAMNEWGMIIFLMLAGLGAVYYLRRQRTAKS